MSASHPGRAKNVSLGGAVLAALAASSCCIGPLIVAALGVGGAGAFAVLGAYRSYILAGTAVLLASGFYLTYRKPSGAAAGGEACGCEKPDRAAGRAGRLGLWTATVLVALSAAAPQLLSIAARQHGVALTTTPGAPLEHATIQVEGMDCEACSVHLRAALTKVGGFHDLTLDLHARTIDVAYEPAAGRLSAYVAAINEIGYEASLPVRSNAPAR